MISAVRQAVCDPDAFYPLRRLVAGPLTDLSELQDVERFVRTVVLHDEIVMELIPWAYDPEADAEFTEEERLAGGRNVITAVGPVLKGYDFFAERNGPQPVPDIDLAPPLLQLASEHANAGEGNVYYKTHVDFLKRTLGVVAGGGSALLCSSFGQQAIHATRHRPEDLFRQLDDDWRQYARDLQHEGLGLLVPPVLGILLTRCGRRDAIPYVIRDLRQEWAEARRKVWDLLDRLRTSPTLTDANEIRSELSEASRLFSPNRSEVDTRPIRVLWEILAAASSGAVTAQLSGGNPVIGAVTNALGQAARSLPALTHEFGPMMFGRGAFDLARRVRREASRVEFEALPRLLTEPERRKLGFG